jgi:hypothetical protein
MDCLKHQQRLPQVPPTVFCDSLIEGWNLIPPLLLPYVLQDITYLNFCWRCNSDKQRSATNRRNNVACRVRQQNEPQIRTVLLHCPPERGLCIPCQMVRFVDDHNFETLLCTQIDLLRLRHLLEQVLDDYPVVVSDI